MGILVSRPHSLYTDMSFGYLIKIICQQTPPSIRTQAVLAGPSPVWICLALDRLAGVDNVDVKFSRFHQRLRLPVHRTGGQRLSVYVERPLSTDLSRGVPVRVQDDLSDDEIPGGYSLAEEQGWSPCPQAAWENTFCYLGVFIRSDRPGLFWVRSSSAEIYR